MNIVTDAIRKIREGPCVPLPADKTIPILTGHKKRVVINFTLLANKVESGEKRQTIRKLRKTPIKVGDLLRLYSGLRTKRVRLIKSTLCTETFFIEPKCYTWTIGGETTWKVNRYETPKSLTFRPMTDQELDDLAKRDGFETITKLMLALNRLHPNEPFNTLFQVIRW